MTSKLKSKVKQFFIFAIINLLVGSAFGQKTFIDNAERWEGIGYQKDLNGAWKIELCKFDRNSYFINYPDSPCSGEWRIIKTEECRLFLIEEIKDDICKCIAKMEVVITQINDNNLSVAFFMPGDKAEPTAFGILKKQTLR